MLENLRRLREEAGLSQRQLAELVSVSQQSINKYENHNIEPDIATLIRIADAFSVSVDYLIGHSAVRNCAGPSGEERTKEEQKFLLQFRKLTKKQQACVVDVTKTFLSP